MGVSPLEGILSPAPPGEVRVTVLDAPHTVLTLDGVLSAAECRALVAATEALGYAEAPITTATGFVMNPDVRDNTRVMLDDVPSAVALWARIAPHLPAAFGPWQLVGLNERLRFYRYEPGQRFDWHADGAFVRSSSERSLLTVLFYLGEGRSGAADREFEGGETRFRFHPRDRSGECELAVEPSRGGVLVFAHALYHQGAPVTAGLKYVMRSDVMARRA